MNPLDRRSFLKSTSVTAASTLMNLKLASYAAADTTNSGDDCKTLLVLDLDGGMDGFHLLVPRDEERHAVYAQSRSNLHLPISESLGQYRQPIIPLTESDGGSNGELYGLHASAPGVADMFNGTGNFDGKPCASFVGNVGTLIKPLTIEQYFDGLTGIDIPVGVGGHFRQAEQWQTALPQGTVNLRGWLGRTADLIHGNYNRAEASMNISLSGNNLLQTGVTTRSFAYNKFLSNGLSQSGANPDSLNGLKNIFHRRIHDQESRNFVDRAFNENSHLSLEKQVAIREAYNNFDRNRIEESFGGSSLESSFESALIMIAVAQDLGLRRLTLYLETPGYDMHFEVPEAFAGRIGNVSRAVAKFQYNLNEMGLADSTIGFTTSEFARTLRSTGAGSDHAWGGPQMVFGGPIRGGKVLGQYPELALRGPLDTGRGGRFLPTTSCDEYFAEALRWFGVPDDKLELVMPNYGNFRGRPAVGYLA